MPREKISERMTRLSAMPVVKYGPAWLQQTAQQLAADVGYPIEKAVALVNELDRLYAISASGLDARKAELRETAQLMTGAPRPRPSPEKSERPLTGDPVKDARILELRQIARDVSRSG